MLRPYLRRVRAWTHPRNAFPVDEDGRVAQHFHVGHLGPAAGARGPAAGHHLTRADQEGLQSAVPRSCIGSRMPCRRAASSASGYPASACRATPIPGSFVRTRSRRRAAASVLSATITCPACSELPIPTPPPWWNDTHDAPDAVLSSAFKIAQSAIASEPSRIASVSRNGEATEPVSR